MLGAFDVTISESGDLFNHENGDPARRVIARMPHDGYYFDSLDTTMWNCDFKPPSIESQKHSDWRRLDEDTLTYLQAKSNNRRRNTDKALVLTNWVRTGLGAPSVGSIPDWLTLLVSEPGYVGELFDLATEIALI